MSKAKAYFKLFESESERFGKQWFWSLHAPNNKVILQSEGYDSKFGAIKGTLSVRFNSVRRKAFDDFRGEDKEFYFRMKALNHKTIGVSEGYKRKAGRENGIESVRRNAPFARMRFIPLA